MAGEERGPVVNTAIFCVVAVVVAPELAVAGWRCLCGQQTIFLIDACTGVVDVAACSTVFNGVLTRGLHAGLVTYANLMPELLARRNSAAGISTADVEAVVRVGACYFPPCVDSAQHTRTQQHAPLTVARR